MKNLAQPGTTGRRAGKSIGQYSAVEDLGLSVRTRNAVRGMGCRTVADVLELDLSFSLRGMGRKTREELLAALERAGFHHPATETQSGSEIRILDRRLERMQERISAALSAAVKEIHSVRRKLHGSMSPRARGKSAAQFPPPVDPEIR